MENFSKYVSHAIKIDLACGKWMLYFFCGSEKNRFFEYGKEFLDGLGAFSPDTSG